MTEFVKYGKTPRLFRDIVITEKLDGTNSAIIFDSEDLKPFEPKVQSRNRFIAPGKETDNYGFAGWVYDNKDELFSLLGWGVHFGEWWGQGIARRYDQEHKTFSLFNTHRFNGLDAHLGAARLNTVPMLYSGPFFEERVSASLYSLQAFGSEAAPGFMNPEGICVYHTQAKQVFKVTLDNEDRGKWEV